MEKSVVASTRESQKKAFITQERQGFEKISTEIKESIFQVLYLILKDEDDSLLAFIFSAGADYLQNLAFSFYQKIYSVWKATSLLNFVFNFFNFFQLQTYFGSAFTYTNYIITFYLTVAVIILVFINIIYVSYAFSKKRVSAIWPVVILRSITSLVFTLFFLPLTQLLVEMIQCQTDSDGRYVLSNFTTVECFKGAQIIHATVAIVSTALFAIIGLVVSLAYFEVRMLTEDSTARQHSRGDVIFTINKILLQLGFAFFSDQWILILILIIPAILLWYVYNIEEPYYNKHCTMFFRIATTYYLWTQALVAVSKLLENTTFTGGLITWVVGLPFIGAIMLTSSKSKASSLVKTSSRFKTSDDLLDHLRFVLQLIDTYKTDKNASILLTGYIEKHKDTCEEEDCPLRVTRKRRASTGGADQLDQMILGLILVVDRMYEAGMKKFKNSAKLRIAYCVFLIERKKNTKKAEQELARAKEMNLGFVDEFTIFRLTKLINDGFEGVDVVGLIAWENYKNLYNEYVKQSADLHKEFWLELKEDRPNLLKLNYLGSKINTALTYAQDYWSRLQKIRSDDPVILRTYGKFLIDIQNDIVEGMDIMQKAKKLMAKKVHYQFARKNSFDAGTLQHPYVEVIGNGNDIGKIKSANLLFTILVGIHRDEIIDKKINHFMPDLFATYHDAFLKNYNTREEEVDTKYLDNDNELFIKSKSGYIIPVLLRVSRIKSEEASNQLVFGAWLRNEHSKRSYVYFICQADGTITDMTATAVTVLNLNLQQVKKTRMTIDKIVPGALTEKGFRERGKEVLYRTDSNVSMVLTAMILPMQLRDKNNVDFRDLYQTSNPGKPALSANGDVYGYIVRVEKIEKNVEAQGSGSFDMSRHLSEKTTNSRRPSHLLEFDHNFKVSQKSQREEVQTNAGQIIYGFDTEKRSLEINELFQNDGGVKLDFENLLKGDAQVERNHFDYGEGIRHKKYIGGRLIEFGDEAEEAELARQKQWEEDAEDEESLFIKEDEDLNGLDSKKRKDKLSALKRLVKSALETNSRTSAISRLKGLTCLWILSIIAIGILQYVFLHAQFNDYNKKLQVIDIYSHQISEINQINTYIIDFITLNTVPALETSYADANIAQRREDLKSSVTDVVNLAGQLNEDQYLSYLKSFDELTLDIVVYTVSDEIVIQKIQSEAIAFITAKAYALHQMDLSDFTLDNPQVQTVLFNYINTILPAMRIMINKFSADLTKSLESFESQFIILFAVNFICALFSSFWGVRSLNNIEQQKSDVLLLFLEIPLRNVEVIGKKRDKFIEFFDAVTKRDLNDQLSDDESDGSIEQEAGLAGRPGVFDSSLNNGVLNVEDLNTNEEQEEALKNRKKLIKKYRSINFQKTKENTIKASVFILLSIVCSLSNSIQLIVTKHDLLHYTLQFSTNSLFSDTIITTLNRNRLMLVTPNLILNGMNIETGAYQSLQDLDALGDDLRDFFLYLTSLDNTLKDNSKQFYNQNACLQLTNQTEISPCETSLNQALTLGFLNLRDEIFKLVVQAYDSYQADPNPTDDDYITLFEINDSYNRFAYNILLNFNLNEEDYLENILSNASSLQEIIIIVYLLVIILLAVYFWIAFILKLDTEIWRTTRMITMIPLDVVNNIPNIKNFLKNIIRKSS